MNLYLKIQILLTSIIMFACSNTYAGNQTIIIEHEYLPCVVENSQYHRYERDDGESYGYGSDQYNKDKTELYRKDYLINNDEVYRFEGWIKPVGNPAVQTLDREQEILSFLRQQKLQIEPIDADDYSVHNTISLTEDANRMSATYRLGFMDEQNCPQPYLTDRVECIGQIIAKKLEIKNIGNCKGTENISTHNFR